MKMIRAGLIAGLILVNLSGCGSDEAPPRTTARTSFETSPYGERVFEDYRKTGTISQEVTLPKGSREVAVNMDCAGSQGRLKVDFATAGGAGIACTPKRTGRGGLVVLGGDGSLLDRRQTITITGPSDQQWSVAIDAGAKVTSN